MDPAKVSLVTRIQFYVGLFWGLVYLYCSCIKEMNFVMIYHFAE
uniref:Uncharacterized protein n=1 Tax=Oryza punctata TaxID=4537 RepID=A0A0E0KMD5_ORYPU